MSLAVAVLAVAEGMEQEAVGECGALRSFASQLRIAVKASGGERPTVQAPSGLEYTAPEVSHRDMLERAKLEFRKERAAKQTILAEDGVLDGADSVYLVDDNDPNAMMTLVPKDPALRIGMTPIYGDQVYVYRDDGKLHLSHEETAKYRKSRGMA